MSQIDPDNPFASPLEQARPEPSAYTNEEAVRRRYLNHEASIQSMGALYMIGGAFGILGAAVLGIATFGGAMVGDETLAAIVVALAIFGGVAAISAFQLWTGLKLYQLDPIARVPAIVLAAIGLTAFPLGTLLSAYFLYLVVSAKGSFVLSRPYVEIRRATPHIKYKTSIVVWILLALVLVLLVGGCLGSLFLR
jgi:hypothetical protein